MERDPVPDVVLDRRRRLQRIWTRLSAVAAIVMALIAMSAWSRTPAHVEVVSGPGTVSLLRDQLIRWQAEDQARTAMPTATDLLSPSSLTATP
jgi:hypothetical protein